MAKILNVENIINLKGINKKFDELDNKIAFLENHSDKDYSKKQLEAIELNLESIITDIING